MDTIGLDCFSIALQFLPYPDLQSCRLASRSLKAAADSEVLWNAKCRELGIAGVRPATSWKDFAQRVALPKIPDGLTINGDMRTIFSYHKKDDDDDDAAARTATDLTADTLVANPDTTPETGSQLRFNTDSEFIRATSAFANLGPSITSGMSSRVLGIVTTTNTVTPTTHEIVKHRICAHVNLLPGLRGALNTFVPASATEEEVCRIECLDVFPTDSKGHPLIVLHLRADHGTQHPRLLAKLTDALFNVCSSITLVGETASDVETWLHTVGAALPDVDPVDPFSNESNLPHLHCAVGDGSLSENDCVWEAMLQGLKAPAQLSKYIHSRAIIAAPTPLGASSGPDSVKPYRLPAWIDPIAEAPVPPAATLRMLDLAINSVHTTSVWSTAIMSTCALGALRRCSAFYANAMSTEIEDVGRTTEVDTISMPHPMLNREVVELHDHFFYAALRMFCIELDTLCGRSQEASGHLMEQLKRDISTLFRDFYRENHMRSRALSGAVFDRVFAPLEAQFYGKVPTGAEHLHVDPAATSFVASNNGFNHKHGLKRWFRAVMDKIGEYELKAEGPRAYDVLSENIHSRIVGGIVKFCEDNPDHPHLHLSDVRLACQDLEAETTKYVTDYRGSDGELLQSMQRNSAIYTSYVGSEWTAQALANAAQAFRASKPISEKFFKTVKTPLVVRSSEEGAPLSSSISHWQQEELLAMSLERQGRINECVLLERERRNHVVSIAAMLPKDAEVKACDVVPATKEPRGRHGSSRSSRPPSRSSVAPERSSSSASTASNHTPSERSSRSSSVSSRSSSFVLRHHEEEDSDVDAGPPAATATPQQHRRRRGASDHGGRVSRWIDSIKARISK